MKVLMIAAAASSALLFSWFALPPIFVAFAESNKEVSEAEIEQAMQSKKFVAMISGFDRYFPEEADRIRSEFRRILSNRADDQTAFLTMSNLTREIVAVNAHYLKAAPDEDLITVIMSDAALIKRIAHDPMLCSQFARSGTAGLTVDQTKLLKLDEFDLEVVLRAIHNGSVKPVARADATGADFEALYQETLRVGGSEEGWRGFESADADSRETCNTALYLYDVLIAGNFQNASAVRASFVSGSRSGP